MIKLLVLIVLLSGCSFSRTIEIDLTAKGAKAKAYGELQEGDAILKTTTNFNLFQKGGNNASDTD